MSSPNPVEYRQLGKSGLKVSVPILGCMSYGYKEWAPWTVDEGESFKILQAAWDKGINTFDTSNNYSNGGSERILGKWIEQSKIPRERIIVATKCYGLVGHTPDVWAMFATDLKHQRDYINQSGLSRAAIFNAVEASLARLNLTYIDLYQIHRFDPDTPAEETMKALHDLVESGKVRYIGASSMRAWQFAHLNEVAEKHGWTKFVSMQNEYSLLYREEEREMNAYCKFNGIGIISWSPLGGGDLARAPNTETIRTQHLKPKLSETDEKIVRRVEEIATKRGLKMAHVAVAWVASKVVSPIIGANSVERLGENITTDVKLTEEEIKYLEELYEPRRVKGHA
ncbi:NADP-dependent oxidoreductase domain-containing protein [Lyophyllum atratum]|nr:NADP-dependent oxidoreductase domain-containing protein [Lyophyllum atratum]